MNNFRTAQAGDICVLVYPELDERMQLRGEQEMLMKAYGGWVVPEPHITIQRFRITHEQGLATAALVADRFRPLDLNSVIEHSQEALGRIAPFTVCAAGLTQFLAPFWGTYVLRWQVEQDTAWNQMINVLESALKSTGCELHYHHEVTPTCSAVDLTHQIKLEDGPQFSFPRPLFTVRRVVFTGVLGMNDFETLGMAKVGV